MLSRIRWSSVFTITLLKKKLSRRREIQPSVILRNREPKGRWNFQLDLGKQRERSISRFPSRQHTHDVIVLTPMYDLAEHAGDDLQLRI